VHNFVLYHVAAAFNYISEGDSIVSQLFHPAMHLPFANGGKKIKAELIRAEPFSSRHLWLNANKAAAEPVFCLPLLL